MVDVKLVEVIQSWIIAHFTKCWVEERDRSAARIKEFSQETTFTHLEGCCQLMRKNS